MSMILLFTLMPSALDVALIIPFLPFIGGLFIGILLLSFNRTMNRLSKPVAFILISCISISAITSYFLLANELSTESIKIISFSLNPLSSSENNHIDIIIDKLVSVGFSIVSTLAVISTLIYHLKMYRKQRYVFYFVLISFASSLILLFTTTPIAKESISYFIA